MSAVEWSDAEREAVRGALLVDLDVPRVTTEDVDAVLAALAPFVEAGEAQAAANALREAVEKDAVTIPDVLGYKVPAVAVEDLLNRADRIERG